MNEYEKIQAWLGERTDGDVTMTGERVEVLPGYFAWGFIENGDGFRFDGYAAWSDKGRVLSAETAEDLVELLVVDQG